MAFESLGVFLFNFWLVSLMLPIWAVASIGNLCCRCCKCGEDCLARVVIFMTAIAWRTTMLMSSCFIHVDVKGLNDFRTKLGSTGRPAVLIANHTSFLDTILILTLYSLRHSGSVRMFVGNHLFKMPLLGSIVKAMGHLSVPFKSGQGGKFEVDKEEMAVRMKQLQDHVEEGNFAAWFPEGQVNLGDVMKLQMFRAGGFTIPVNVDVELWCLAAVGNGVCWPGKSSVGGRPAQIGVKIWRLCESSQDFISEINGSEQDKCRFMANESQKAVQKVVDELAADGFVATADDEDKEALLKTEA